MSSGESCGGGGDLSPDVERFLRPRTCPADYLLPGGAAGAMASFAALAVLAYCEQHGMGNFVLSAKVTALKLIGSPVAVDSTPGVTVIAVACLGLGTAGGALFGLLISLFVGKAGLITALCAGLTYGVLIWCIGQFVVVASIAPNAVLLANQYVMIVAHATYGAVLGLTRGWSLTDDGAATTFSLRRLWG